MHKNHLLHELLWGFQQHSMFKIHFQRESKMRNECVSIKKTFAQDNGFGGGLPRCQLQAIRGRGLGGNVLFPPLLLIFQILFDFSFFGSSYNGKIGVTNPMKK